MAFASTRSSADSRFILGGLLLTLALAVLGRTMLPTYRRRERPHPKSALPRFGRILRTPKRSTIEWIFWRFNLVLRFPGFPERLLLRGYQQNPRCSLSSLRPPLAKDCRLSLQWIKCPNRSLWI